MSKVSLIVEVYNILTHLKKYRVERLKTKIKKF